MLPTLNGPELVFGICSPIGTNNSKITALIKKNLLYYSYQSTESKVTKLMRSIVVNNFPTPEDWPTEKRYDSLIKYANRIREVYAADDLLAMVSCTAITEERKALRKKKKGPQQYHAYIFDQFKRTEEVKTLQQVYGKLFILVSVYSERSERVSQLTQRICSDRSMARPTVEDENKAKEFVVRDEDEEGEPHGQRLREVFALGDLFVNLDDLEDSEKVIARFLRSFFGANDVSPSGDEYGMYIAKAASLRSLDLSRQVGAAIFSEKGEVITLGSNEVPKPHGGTYWADDSGDARDYVLGRDENERIKRAILFDVAKRLHEGGFNGQGKSEEEIVQYILKEATRRGSLLREALVMDLLEFGRAIHAEMLALSDAARLGKSVRGTILFCTTFPCHICAKHIIAAGIKKVVFIEPYPKSYAEQLLSSIVVRSGSYSGDAIQFAPFIGASPRRFKDLYERGRRKDTSGNFEEWADGKPEPTVKYTVPTYLENEKALVAIFKRKTRTLMDAKVLTYKGS